MSLEISCFYISGAEYSVQRIKLISTEPSAILRNDLEAIVIVRQGSIEQQSLFESTSANGASAFADPAFARNKTAPVHRWVPWIAGFSREFVQGALERYLRKGGTVLDPFAGVGTTLVEAALAGCDAIGFEINPYAALACRTKLTAYEHGPAIVAEAIEAFEVFYRKAIREEYVPQSKSPAGFKTRGEFYSPKVLQKILIVHDFISSLDDNTVNDIFRVVFASTMVRYSNYSYEPSLGRRVSAGKEDIEDFPVGETIAEKLREVAYDIAWMRQQLNGRRPTVRVFNESFFNCRERIDNGSVVSAYYLTTISQQLPLQSQHSTTPLLARLCQGTR